jgi:hypothetical protein
MKYTYNSEPKDIFKRWVGISVIAACLRRKVKLQFGFDWVYPNMYIILTGPSGRARKGTALSPGLSMLREKGIPLAAESTTREALIKAIEGSVTECLTDERGMVQEVQSSLTIYSPELAVFLGYDNKDMMAALCDWWDCPNIWDYDTKNKGKNELKGVWVNMIGGTTPELLQEYLTRLAIGGGLASRVIFVYAGDRGKLVPCPVLTAEELEVKKDLSHDLDEIKLMRGEFKRTEEWWDLWQEWYTTDGHKPPFEDERFEPYASRRPMHLMKLCMVINASRHDGRMILTKADLAKSIDLLKTTELEMRKAFGGVGRQQYAGVTNRIMQVLDERGRIEPRELLNMFYHDIDSKEFTDIMSTLSEMGYCQIIKEEGGETWIVKR